MLAQDTKLSRAFEHEKDPETVMRAAAGGKGSGVSNKPYRYIDGYSLKGTKVSFWGVGRRGEVMTAWTQGRRIVFRWPASLRAVRALM